MTTTRERALEAALRICLEAAETMSLHPSAQSRMEARRSRDRIQNTAGAALALPPSPEPQPSPVAAGEHTPGPWHIKQAESGHTAIYPENSRERVADIYCPLDVDGHHAANARLIAAAPDMLAALQQVAAQPDNTSGDRGPIKYARHIAKCAIARATGREG